jgi:hypothetical protein
MQCILFDFMRHKFESLNDSDLRVSSFYEFTFFDIARETNDNIVSKIVNIKLIHKPNV